MLELTSYAKLNRSLLVYPPMETGYHPIQSVFQTISLADTMTVSKLGKGEFVFECSDSNVPVDETNSVVAVFEAYADRLPCGFELFLEKQIPMGAGLGGGSSNAATFLRYLNDHYLKMPMDQLRAESVQFGADVAFFLDGGRAFVSGIGDQVEPLPRVATEYYVLLYPNVHAGTVAVYQAFDRMSENQGRALLTQRDVIDKYEGYNDLFGAAVSLYPEIQAVADWADANDTPCLMTGSGSTLYWVFDDESGQRQFFDVVKRQFPEDKAFLAGSV